MEYITVTAAIILELLSSLLIINGLLGKGRKIPLIWAVTFVILSTGYFLFIPDPWVNGCYVLMLLYVKAGYGISWKDCLLTVIPSLVVVGLVELICFFPFGFIFYGRWPNQVNHLLADLGSTILCYVLVWKLPIWYVKKWCGKREIWYLAVVVFSSILMLSAIIRYNVTLELQLGDYIYIIVALILVWLLSFRLMKYCYEERFRKKYLRAFRSVIDQIRSRQHKFQNQLDAVYSLHNLYDEYETLVEEQRKYLGKLVDYEMPADVLVLENPVLIAHVYEKITEAQEAGLRIKMKLKGSLEKCALDDIHMVEILGTLFDNAIQDMKETKQTEYLVFEVEKEDGLIIRVANPHDEVKNQEMRHMFENGYSTKGKDHGIGLYHVKKLVQKHKIELLAENRLIEERNYLCFSLMIGRSTPLV